eukprot:225619_1
MERWGEIVVNETGHERKLTKDSLCSICLVDYTKGNLLRYPCNTHTPVCFHHSITKPIEYTTALLWQGVADTALCMYLSSDSQPRKHHITIHLTPNIFLALGFYLVGI